MKSKSTLIHTSNELSIIPSSWIWKTIDDIKKEEKGSMVSGPFGSNIGSKFFRPIGIPVIRGNNLTTGKTRFLDNGFVFVDDEKAKELSNCISIKDDIIFTAAGTLGQIGIIPTNSKYKKYIISNKQLRLRVNSSIVIPQFVYYWFSSKKMRNYIMQHNVGSSVPLITLRVLRNLPIPIPSINEQHKIVNILDPIDENIFTLRKINKISENLGYQIFKSWFNDFKGQKEFIDSEFGRIPQGWKVTSLKEIGKIISGKTPPTKDEKNYGKDFPFIRIPDMHDSVFVIKTARYISELGKSKFENFLLPPYSVCVSCIATPGLVSLTYTHSFTNQQINSIICDNEISSFFVYYALKDIRDEIIRNASGGTATPNLNKNNFSDMKIIVPPTNLINNFHIIVKPIFEKIFKNMLMINNLKIKKDSLLPKLMSGEIRV